MPNDQIEQLICLVEQKESEGRAIMLDALEELDRRQVFNADGYRSMSEWAAAKLDVSANTAKKLVRTMRRTAGTTEVRSALASGKITFDRAAALSKLDVGEDLMTHLDIAGLERWAASSVERSEDDQVTPNDRYLVMQPSLDESWWRIWGGLDGATGSVIDRALSEKADELPELPDGTRGAASWRRATALYVLATGGQSPKAEICLFVDAERATESEGANGVQIAAGPRAGADMLEAILCDSVTEVVINTADGEPLRYGRRSRTIPATLRNAVLSRNGGHCEIDGCNSRYRVEVHHRVPWSEQGRTDPENLIGLCWFHHHIVVHERGFLLFRHPDHGRWRLEPASARQPVGRKPKRHG